MNPRPHRLALLICRAAWLGCAHPAPPPGDNLLLPLESPRGWLPEVSDRAAARAAVAALADHPVVLERAIARVRASDDSHKGEDLDSLLQDLENSTLPDAAEYRAASRKLSRSLRADPALEARLNEAADNDLLDLATQRQRDTWEIYWARTFNAASEPLGQALFNGFVFAPIQVSNSAAHYLASFSNDEALPMTSRQALVLRREYLDRHPTAADAEEIRKLVEEGDRKLARTMRTRRLRVARKAESMGRHRIAQIESELALFWGPDPEAEAIRTRAAEEISKREGMRANTLAAAPLGKGRRYTDKTHALVIELLRSSSRGSGLPEPVLDGLRKRGEGLDISRGEAAFILSIAQREAGFEDPSWRTLADLGSGDPRSDSMVRHASHLFTDPWQHPYRAYRTMKDQQQDEETRWRLLGNYASGSRYPNLSPAIAYTLEAPGILTTLIMSPLRMIFGRWKKERDFQQPTAVLAYRYLGRNPLGVHRHDVMQWLFEYEQGRDNDAAALRLADFLPGMASDERNKLAEAASEQALSSAASARRPDRRIQMFRYTSMEYPDHDAGKRAGKEVRRELEDGSAQKISMTRDFLIENPHVAGRKGLGINPILINEVVEDGELHSRGVSFMGGRILRFDLLNEDGDEELEPVSIRKQVSSERLARLAAVLDETTRRNQLLDRDDILEADADRDQFLERARLEELNRPDERPSAQSTYVYQSMRERYGLVRGRESVLPFDLVVQGSLQDLSLGAFPRWRPPKQTPDAFLYR